MIAASVNAASHMPVVMRLLGLEAGAVAAVSITIPGIEFTAKDNRLHFTAPDSRLHFTSKEQ